LGRDPRSLEQRTLFRALAIVVLACALISHGFAASLLLETATPGNIGQTGGIVLSKQILGARFHVESAVQIQEIGGHILGHQTHLTGYPEGSSYGTLFGAVIRLSGPTALPTERPDSLTPIPSTTFTPSFPSQDIVVALSVTLPPGDYALIFGGAGLFGVTGEGSMADNNIEIPGNASVFSWTEKSNEFPTLV
jgi:opacity protein-like surface antigen